MKNGLAAGVRQASDFLMALQLTGAAKTDSVANLQVRLPVVVIGGGLTAIDTATEALAYYPLQVEKFLAATRRWSPSAARQRCAPSWTPPEAETAEEFLDHARKIRAERAAAAREGRAAAISPSCCGGWGGVTIVYRRRLIDAPSYTLNHEEVAKALEEGIRFAERLTPGRGPARRVRLGARAAPVVARPGGQQSGRAAARDRHARAHHPGRRRHPAQHRARRARSPATSRSTASISRRSTRTARRSRPSASTKPSAAHVLMSLRPDGRAISFFGDLHPSFAGNVVKAMASAKQGYPVVSRMLARRRRPAVAPRGADGAARRRACARRCTRSSGSRPTSSRWWCARRWRRAPSSPASSTACRTTRRCSRNADGTRLAMEGLALTGASVDREQGLLSTIVLEMGGSSDLCAQLEPGEPVVLMGPTGHADRDSGRRDRAADRRRARQRGAVLDRTGAAREGQPRALFRRLQAGDRPLQGRGDRAGRRCHRVVLRRGAGLSRPSGRRTWPSSATSWRRSTPTAPARSVAADLARRGRPRHRDRLRRHDGRGRRARGRASWPSISSPGTRRSPPSTRRCSA